jgi:hypothetical protein
MFTTRIKVSGNLLSTYVFTDAAASKLWRETELKELEKEHGPLTTHEYPLDDLPGIGDKCHVMGDGDSVYTVEKLIKYSANRYGFILDSGWTEEVWKCYKVD